MLIKFYQASSLAISPLVPLILNYRCRRGKEDPNRIYERLGISIVKRPEGKLIWIHAASIGEAKSVIPLTKNLHESGCSVLLTTGTKTSAYIISKEEKNYFIHQYCPVDTPHAVNRFLEYWKPNLAVWVESEFWPNMIFESRKRKIPTALIQGRLSKTSFKRWKLLKGFAKKILADFNPLIAQTKYDASLFKLLGGKNILSGLNLKLDAPKLKVNLKDLRKLRSLIGDRPCWLASSTHNGEEEAVIDAHLYLVKKLPNLLTIIIPRHPERKQCIIDLIKKNNILFCTRSENEIPNKSINIYLADTLGELGTFYSLASIVFMGGSLVLKGGHNLFEPASFSLPIICGPSLTNNIEIADKLINADALIRIDQSFELGIELEKLFKNPSNAIKIGKRAKSAIHNIPDSKSKITNLLISISKDN